MTEKEHLEDMKQVDEERAESERIQSLAPNPITLEWLDWLANRTQGDDTPPHLR